MHAQKHPALHANRHVNEHITFCALHTRRARDPSLCAAARTQHRQAAKAHLAQALHHLRAYGG